MSFIVKEIASETKTLTQDSHIVFAIDNSGSTMGQVLEAEKKVATSFSAPFSKKTFIFWNSRAQVYENAFPENIHANGGTSPSTFLSAMYKDKIECDFLVLITDGQIGDIEYFRRQFCAQNLQCPILVILTFNLPFESFANPSTSCDMSIVEACLSASSNVAVCTLFATNDEMRIFQGTGYFQQFLRDSASSTAVSDCQSFGVQTMWPEKQETFSITMKLLPNDVVQCDNGLFFTVEGFFNFLNTVNLDQDQDQLIFALNQATKRTNLMKFDVGKTVKAIHVLNQKIEAHLLGSEITNLQETLFNLTVSLHNGDDDTVLRSKIASVREELAQAKKAKSRKTISKELRTALQEFTSVIGAYKEDKSLFDYGSNRASAAQNVDETQLENVAKCVQGECPVMLEQDSLVIFFTAPPKALGYTKKSAALRIGALTDAQKQSVAKYFTRNVMIDCPDLAGAAMREALTPGLFGLQFAKMNRITQHPLSKYPILGFLPLSYDMRVLIRHLSMIFTNGKEMPFLLRAYVAMVANHMSVHKWAPKELRDHATFVLNTLLIHCPFIKQETKKQQKSLASTYADSVKCILSNPNFVRRVSHGQAISLMCIADQLMPEFVYDKVKIRNVVQFVNCFRQIREKYILLSQTNVEPMTILGEAFDGEYHERSTLYGQLALVFAYFHLNTGHTLRLLRFQQCLDKILEHQQLQAIFDGTATKFTEKLIPQVSNDPHFDLAEWKLHFQEVASSFRREAPVQAEPQQSLLGSIFSTIGSATSRLFYGSATTTHQCRFCNENFSTAASKKEHIKQKLGNFGRLDLESVLRYNPAALDDTKNVLQYFQKRYGADCLEIYSEWTRSQIQNLQHALQFFPLQPQRLSSLLPHHSTGELLLN